MTGVQTCALPIFNIQAVSFSQGHHTLLNGTSYCPSTPLTQGVLKALLASDIPAFVAAGNDKDYKRINWPACLPEAVAIGGSAEGDYIAPYSNFDANLLDFYALGSMRVKIPGGTEVNAAGTSISTAVAAATYIKVKSNNLNFKYADVINKFNQSAIQIAGRGTSGKLINVASL